jgi:hypothetical protein
MAKDERAAAKSTDPVSVVRFGRRRVEVQFTRDNATLLAQLAGRLKLALSAESGDVFFQRRQRADYLRQGCHGASDWKWWCELAGLQP